MTVSKIKPDWAGEDRLSQLVNRLIQIKPLYALMKHQARRVMIHTAEKKGISWRRTAQALDTSQVKSLLPVVTNPAVVYPDYYQVPFHAYEAGNLCWLAAFEAESATYAMALRVWPEEALTWEEAQERLRSSFYLAVAEYLRVPVQDVLDIGCSIGVSTHYLHQFFQKRQSSSVKVTGLDLSPFMLAVARFQDTQQAIARWVHATSEETGFPDDSFDLVTMQFVIHELPRYATQAIFQEVKRILRPGGCFALLDNNPQSKVIQGLPPAIFTLMKSTEPWSDDYYTFDVESALKTVGFSQVLTRATDPRHRAIIATAPC